MGQVCIMNTFPELAITSCNTISNSRITCMQCVPPYRLKRSSGYHKKKKETRDSNEHLAESSLNVDDPNNNSNNSNSNNTNDNANSILGLNANMYSVRSRFLIQQLSEHLNSNLEPESLIDYDSSEDEDGDSQASGNEKETSSTTPQTSPSAGSQTNSLKSNNNNNNSNNIPSLTNNNNFQDTKHSTMWVGNEDGR